MPFCTQCGVDNPASARFCDQCGTPLVQVTNAPAPSAAAPVVAPAPAAPAPAPAAAPISAGPSTCPQCGSAVIPGEAFCDNCGAPLSVAPSQPVAVPQPPYSPGLAPQPSYPPPQAAQPAAAPPAYSQPAAPPSYSQPPQPAYTPPPAPVYTPPPQPATPARSTLAPARLVATATGATIGLPAAGQVIIGRADPVSQFRPDLDLTAFGALEQGVGRRHARLFVQDGQIQIEDMESTNGTLVNGQRLTARRPQPLRDGDQIQLGRLALRIQL